MYICFFKCRNNTFRISYINKIIINIHSARPGVVIGRKGVDIAKIKKDISNITPNEVIINITEVKKAETEPFLVAKNVADQLEKRVSFRKKLKVLCD